MRLHFLLFLLSDHSAFVAFVYANKCFADNNELKAAVDQYVDEEDCANNDGCTVGQMYGWPIGTWCVGNVTDMSFLFDYKSTFNEDLSGWDTSSVTTMRNMFRESAFNGDISRWDVSSVISMFAMFEHSGFNGDISSWDVSSVTSMYRMFLGSSFNGDISKWDVSSVSSMGYTFWGNAAFNQDLCAWGDKFQYDYAYAFDIFADSGCTFQDTPQLDQRGPFCASNCEDQATNPTTEQPSNPEGGDTEPSATAEVTTEPTAPADGPSGNEDEAGSPESSGLRKAISSVAATVALLVAGVLMM